MFDIMRRCLSCSLVEGMSEVRYEGIMTDMPGCLRLRKVQWCGHATLDLCVTQRVSSNNWCMHHEFLRGLARERLFMRWLVQSEVSEDSTGIEIMILVYTVNSD